MLISMREHCDDNQAMLKVVGVLMSEPITDGSFVATTIVFALRCVMLMVDGDRSNFEFVWMSASLPSSSFIRLTRLVRLD